MKAFRMWLAEKLLVWSGDLADWAERIAPEFFEVHEVEDVWEALDIKRPTDLPF